MLAASCGPPLSLPSSNLSTRLQGLARAVQVDLDVRRLTIDHHSIGLRRFSARRSVVPRYIDLVRDVRGVGRGRFALRDADLEAIALALGLGTTFVHDELLRIMERPDWSTRSGLLLGSGGIIVATSVGAALVTTRTPVSPVGPNDAASGLDAVSPAALAGELLTPAAELDTLGLIVPDTIAPRRNDPVAETSPVTDDAVAFVAQPAVVTSSHHAEVGAQALAMISYDWATQLPGWSIEFHPGRSGILGYAFFNERRIEIYVRDHHATSEIAATLAHEIGHAVDVTLLTDAQRWDWMNARGIDADWWPAAGVSDYSSGAGDFAEAFATWQVGEVSRSTVAGQPDLVHLGLIARLAG